MCPCQRGEISSLIHSMSNHNHAAPGNQGIATPHVPGGAIARKIAASGARTDIPFAVVLANGAVLRNSDADSNFQRAIARAAETGSAADRGWAAACSGEPSAPAGREE